MAWSLLYYRNACQKRILAHKLSLIYCEAKIVADSLFVDLFHAVAVRTTLLFWKEFLVKTTSAVSMSLLPSTQVFNNVRCRINH